MAINGSAPKTYAKVFSLNARDALARENKSYNDFNWDDFKNNLFKVIGRGVERPTHKYIDDFELRAVLKQVMDPREDSDALKLGTVYALDALVNSKLPSTQNEYQFAAGALNILSEAKAKLAFDMGADAAFFVRDNFSDQPDLRERALRELESIANKTMDGPNYHGMQGTALKKAVVEVKAQLGIESPKKGWQP